MSQQSQINNNNMMLDSNINGIISMIEKDYNVQLDSKTKATIVKEMQTLAPQLNKLLNNAINESLETKDISTETQKNLMKKLMDIMVPYMQNIMQSIDH